MRFSERVGKRKVKSELQVNSMDDDLRNGLWNVLYFFTFKSVTTGFEYRITGNWKRFFDVIWICFYKRPIDEIDYYKLTLEDQIKKWFFEADYLDVYDFVDFIAKLGSPFKVDEFRKACNQVLESERAAYRFVGDGLSPITSETEIAEIEVAIESANEHKLKGVQVHLKSASDKLSDRKNPDYRNSIKESISAVESLCAVIADDPRATLGKALKLIQEKVSLHPALEQGFSKIYGYTSDEGGIRHAMIDESQCEFDDAKYMLVSCSAFVNYIIGKASKGGLIK